MNIVVVPFHDWRKIILEGCRTRDAHFIGELTKTPGVTTLIINRPTTLLEILIKKKPNLISGKVILAKSNFKLYEIKKDVYLVDYVSKNMFSQAFTGYKWFINQYGNKQYLAFIKDCLRLLNMESKYCLLNQNIFAYKLSEQLHAPLSILDAWDNFLKFKVYKHLMPQIKAGYHTYANRAHFWITNSKDNITAFNKAYKPKKLVLIKNGVDVQRFVQNTVLPKPKDMQAIPHPIIGFGGKISQLLDVALINKVTKLAPNLSFVFVGQILDKQVYKQIIKRPNVFFLGDKHYDTYPIYVKHFDVCIVPYVVADQKKSGANSIKVYEYLATAKKVVGTNANGLEDLSEYVYIANTPQEFVNEINATENKKAPLVLENHSWESKTQQLLNLVNNASTN
ncbi:glycosyltransferase [Bizionia sediminis]|uniref:Glycosyltransferase n=1 Tax=Bizionia sediminis TaxID=1737064 RepID=A0ABW5KT76_9FLAO